MGGTIVLESIAFPAKGVRQLTSRLSVKYTRQIIREVILLLHVPAHLFLRTILKWRSSYATFDYLVAGYVPE